jgi:hypothetical protein
MFKIFSRNAQQCYPMQASPRNSTSNCQITPTLMVRVKMYNARKDVQGRATLPQALPKKIVPN